MAKTKESKIQIKLVRSLIGCSETQRKVAQSLGLKKKDQIVEHSLKRKVHRNKPTKKLP